MFQILKSFKCQENTILGKDSHFFVSNIPVYRQVKTQIPKDQ